MNNKLYPKRLACLIMLCAIFASPIYGQKDNKLIQIGKLANVIDNATPSTFFEIPELKAKDGQLKVNLFIDEQVYDFVESTVKLRTYTYESGLKSSEKIGPWGPTLRIGKNDRLSVTIHNNLPFDQHRNYLGSMPTSLASALNKGGKVRKSLKDSIILYTDSLITPENLVLATIDVNTKNESWTLNGKVPCQCPPGKEGTCTKIAITYPIERMFNYGSNEFALRVYESTLHEGEEHDHNIPHGFNNTNLHAHGFHVSPFQDDIFRRVDPTFSSYYTYDLVDHTPGTMWYHPHVHGSTGIQVASGMSGVVIIEDDPATLRKYPALAAASEKKHERVLLFNQITYDKELGENPDFNTMERVSSEAHTTVNGVAVPKMIMKPGEVQRWRLVHSGYRSTLGLEFPKEAEVWQIAVDGIMFDKPRLMETIHMAPGNRTDLLIKFPKNVKRKSFSVKSIPYIAKCEYFETDSVCLRNEKLYKNNEEIINIRVEGEAEPMKIPTVLPGPGARHEDIPRSELSGIKRFTDFNIVSSTDTTRTQFTVNGEAYNGDTIPEILTLGTADEWFISSSRASHPYHIHINPFLVYTFAGENLKTPMWKDVALVSPSESAVARARYTRYWGDFVIHCHILAHEDEGMMQRVRIVRP